MRVSLGSKVAVSVRTGRDSLPDGRELLALILDFETIWGPVSISATVGSQTLRAILVWLKANYGTLAYDFVIQNRPSIATLLKK